MRLRSWCSVVSARLACRKYLAEILQLAYVGYELWESLEPGSRVADWVMFWRREPAGDSIRKQKQSVLDLYWWLRIVIARETGELPAWEGIRFVREQVDAEH